MQTLTRHLSRSRLRRRVALVAVGAVVGVALTSCSGGDGDSGSADSAGGSSEVQVESSPNEDAAAAEDSALTTGDFTEGRGAAAANPSGTTTVDLDVAALVGRDVIRTATMSVVTKDLEAARSEVDLLMGRLGGAIASESSTVDISRRSFEEQGQVMQLGLQVPTARFDATLDALASLGLVQTRLIQTEDVTTEVADIDSRVESARTALERIRALLDQANSLGTVIRLEGKLSARQADLESLLAQQQAITGQTQLATVQLELRTPDPTPQPTPVKTEDAELTGFVPGLSDGWDALRATLVVVSSLLGVLLPFALLAGLLALPLLAWRRRREPGSAEPLSPPVT